MCHSHFDPTQSRHDVRKRKDYELTASRIDHVRRSSNYWAQCAIDARENGESELWAHFVRNAINTRIHAQAMQTEAEARGITE